jgi:hypothetical protein
MRVFLPLFPNHRCSHRYDEEEIFEGYSTMLVRTLKSPEQEQSRLMTIFRLVLSHFGTSFFFRRTAHCLAKPNNPHPPRGVLFPQTALLSPLQRGKDRLIDSTRPTNV